MKFRLFILLFCLLQSVVGFGQYLKKENSLNSLRDELATGWNTWNNRSVTSYVHLPSGFALNLAFKQHAKNQERYLKEALIGRASPKAEKVFPEGHLPNGAYTSLVLKWLEVDVRIETAHLGEELVVKVTPLTLPVLPVDVVGEIGILWNRDGQIQRNGNQLKAITPKREYVLRHIGKVNLNPNLNIQTPAIALQLTQDLFFYTGIEKSKTELEIAIKQAKQEWENWGGNYKSQDLREAAKAVRACMAWNTIFDPTKNRPLTTVNRDWNNARGGYVVFCWDNFFGAALWAKSDPKWALLNFLETLEEATEEGFIPNNSQGNGRKSFDRSQPPVGGLVLALLEEKFQDATFQKLVFPKLLKWNRWWANNRMYKGLLCWGSSPSKNPWLDAAWHNRLAASLESGADDSPAYEGIEFDSIRHILPLHDVALNSLYVNDCKVLAGLAKKLNLKKEASELEQRAKRIENGLQRLYEPKVGIHLNRLADSREFSPVITPFNALALVPKVATVKQAQSISANYLQNPNQLGGEWVYPSVSRADSNFYKQKYWKGAIWPPMNFLVWTGLRKYPELKATQQELEQKSLQMFLNEFRRKGFVSENYSAIDGTGDDPRLKSNHYYFWGGLMPLMALWEEN